VATFLNKATVKDLVKAAAVTVGMVKLQWHYFHQCLFFLTLSVSMTQLVQCIFAAVCNSYSLWIPNAGMIAVLVRPSGLR
jgi:hypothetical protein